MDLYPHPYNYLCITRILKFGQQNSEEKKFIIKTDFLEFVAAKFNQNLTFNQLFI